MAVQDLAVAVGLPMLECFLNANGTALAATGILAVATLAQAATVAAATTADAVFDLASLRAALKERLRDPALVPDGRRAFVVTDPAVIEPALDRALRFIDLTPPLSAATRERAERSAITYYRLALGEGAGLRALQTRIAAAFAQPEAAVERIANQPGLVVTLDLGWLPGPLSYTSGQGYHIERTTDVFDGYAPSTRLIAGKLADAQMRWPDATQIRLHVRHPYYGRVADYRIVYTLRDGRGATIGRVRTDSPSLKRNSSGELLSTAVPCPRPSRPACRSAPTRRPPTTPQPTPASAC